MEEFVIYNPNKFISELYWGLKKKTVREEKVICGELAVTRKTDEAAELSPKRHGQFTRLS